MEGNDAIVKCSLPSFAADFLEIISWSSDETIYIKKSNFHGNNSFNHVLVMVSYVQH